MQLRRREMTLGCRSEILIEKLAAKFYTTKPATSGTQTKRLWRRQPLLSLSGPSRLLVATKAVKVMMMMMMMMMTVMTASLSKERCWAPQKADPFQWEPDRFKFVPILPAPVKKKWEKGKKLGVFQLHSNKPSGTGSADASMRFSLDLFSRLAVLAQNRSCDMRNVLRHPLGPLPWPLATSSGGFVKTAKSALMPLLEDGVSLATRPTEGAAVVLDAMATIQGLVSVPRTFDKLAMHLLAKATDAGKQCAATTWRVDFVGDRYPDVSIKAAERGRRASGGSVRTRILPPDQPCPRNWKLFMKNGANKEELMQFLFNHWKSAECAQLLQGGCVVITVRDMAYLLKANGDHVAYEEVPNLRSTQEEADTRMLLHAYHASEDYSAVVIRSPDTDVLVLCIALASSIPARLLFETGRRAASRIVDISAVAEKLGAQVCSALLGLHAVTGCDSTSSFYRIGKKKAWKVLKSKQSHQIALAHMGDNFVLPVNLQKEVEKYVCHLYGHPELESINEARFKAFCSRSPPPAQLPPCADSLEQHVKRANYQAGVWKRALVASPDLPSISDHGWRVDDSNVMIMWGLLPPAPPELMAIIRCACATGCSTRRCSCLHSSISCTDACQCSSCANPHNAVSEVLAAPTLHGDNEDSADDEDGQTDDVDNPSHEIAE